MEKKKKAEVSLGVVLGVVGVIIIFALMLFLYWQFNWKGQADTETCHTSVVLKKTTPEITGEKAVELPLKCQTRRICFTTKSVLKGNCKNEFGNLDYEDEVVKNKEELIRGIADLMVEDWGMMGQGKGGMIFSGDLTFKGYSKKGVITTIFAFGEDIKSNHKFGDITTENIYNFMFYKTIGSVDNKGVTYWEYLTGSKDSFVGVPNEAYSLFESSEKYAIIFVEYEQSQFWNIAIPGSIGTVGAIFGSFVGLAGSAAGGIIGTKIGGGIKSKIDSLLGREKYYSGIILIPYNKANLKNQNIDNFGGLA